MTLAMSFWPQMGLLGLKDVLYFLKEVFSADTRSMREKKCPILQHCHHHQLTTLFSHRLQKAIGGEFPSWLSG